MKSNFSQNQITDEYINSIRSKPNRAGIDLYDEKFFSDVDLENSPLNWDHAHHVFRKRSTIIAFFAGYLMAIKLFQVSFIPTLSWEHLFSLSFSSLMGYTLWDQLAGFYFRYRFGKDAMCVRRSENRPAIIYKIVRGTAWFGVAFCIVMGLIFGPMIFVGAGGFALMAFKLIDAKEVILINKVKYNSIFFMQIIEEDSVLEVLFKEVIAGIEDQNKLLIKEDYNKVSFYVKKSDMARLRETIAHINNKVGYEVELINTTLRKDKVNLYEKFRQLNLPLDSVSFDIEKFL